RSESLEDRIKVFHRLIRAADHHAVTTIDAPDATAGANINVVNTLLLQLFGAANVVFEHGIAAIDDDVASFHLAGQSHHRFLSGIPGRHHHPDCAGLAKFADKIVERGARACAFLGELIYRIRTQIRDYDLMAAAHKAPHHVATHPAQTHHSYLHR